MNNPSDYSARTPVGGGQKKKFVTFITSAEAKIH